MNTQAYARPVKHPRSLLPRCLQPRAPARYEILDARERPVPPTLAGYRLRPGREYHLRVETQDGDPLGWSLQVTPPPRFVDWPAGDRAEQSARVLALRTKGYFQDHWIQLFRNPAVHLKVRIQFEDSRRPYEFQIPVLLVDRWLYALFLVGAALPPLIPLPLPWRIATAAGGALVAALLCFAISLARSYKRAKKLIAEVA